MASGHANRINRPNTWLLRPGLRRARKSLPTRSRPHMALFARAESTVRMSGYGGGSSVARPLAQRGKLRQSRPKRCQSWATGARVEEQRCPLPPSAVAREVWLGDESGLEDRSRKPTTPSASKRATHLATVLGVVLKRRAAATLLSPWSTTERTMSSRPFGVR